MVESIFAILHKYAASGLSKGDNFDLVVAAFKVSILIKLTIRKSYLNKQLSVTFTC